MADDDTAPRARFAFLRGAGRDGQRNGLILLAVFYLAWQILAVLYGIGAPDGPTPEYPFRAANYGFTVGIGLLVGATELIARYRDKPFEPLLSSAGLFYMLINAGASALAYYIVLHLGLLTGQHEVIRVLTAGLAAMAFFRSGLFKVRLGGDDVTVGPNLVLQILLDALDRTYDRERAQPRSAAVQEIMAGISFDVAQRSLPRLCYNLMQNVSDEEMASLDLEVRAIDESEGNDDAKALTLGLTLLNLVGQEVLKAAVDALGGALQGVSKISQSVTDKLAQVDPGEAVLMLPRICNEIAHKSRRLPGVEDVEQLGAEIRAQPLPDIAKAFEMLMVLIGRFGEQTVEAALNILILANSARPTPTPPPTPAPSQPPGN